MPKNIVIVMKFNSALYTEKKQLKLNIFLSFFEISFWVSYQ